MTGQIPDMLSQFQFPKEAMQDFQERGLVQRSIAKNVAGFEFNGHDRGLSYRFYNHPVKNQMKSDEFDMELNDDIEMIEWAKDKKNHIPERVHMIGDALLKFRKKKNAVTGAMEVVFPLECVGGLYKDDYLRWKQGLGSLGLELSRWNQLTVGQVKTLNSESIFTVEQFASMPRDRVEGRFPKDLVKAFEAAIQFCNAQKPLEGIKDQADRILTLEQSNSAWERKFADLEARFKAMAGDPEEEEDEEEDKKAARARKAKKAKKVKKEKKAKKEKVAKPTKHAAPTFDDEDFAIGDEIEDEDESEDEDEEE